MANNLTKVDSYYGAEELTRQETSIYKMYIEDKMPIEDIEKHSEADAVEIWNVVRHHGWDVVRREWVKELYLQSELQYAEFLASERGGVLKDQLELAKKLQLRVGDVIDNFDPTDPKAMYKLDALTKSLKGISDITGRILSVSDGSSVLGKNGENLSDLKTPLINLNVQPAAPIEKTVTPS